QPAHQTNGDRCDRCNVKLSARFIDIASLVPLVILTAIPLAAAFERGVVVLRGVDLVKSNELRLSTRSLLCGDSAQRMVAVHRSHNAPLEPLGQVPAQNSSALLGLYVGVLGSEYVRKDLRFNIKIKLGNAERVYHGFWPRIGHSRTDRVGAVRTDWWIDLDRIFTSGDIASVCRVHVPTAVSVELVDYSFSE